MGDTAKFCIILLEILPTRELHKTEKGQNHEMSQCYSLTQNQTQCISEYPIENYGKFEYILI